MTVLGQSGISVIIPCHNDGPYLAEALQSVLDQTLAADEIILIDDGSNDETSQIAGRFSNHIRYFYQANQGIGSARNAGLQQARGRYIAFLDADDVWPPRSLELRFNRCESSGSDAAQGSTEEFLNAGFRADRLGPRLAKGPVLVRLAGAVLVRRAVFGRIGGFDAALSTGEWIDWISRFNHAGCTLTELPELVLRRRIHPGNATGQKPEGLEGYLAVLRSALHRKTSGRSETADAG